MPAWAARYDRWRARRAGAPAGAGEDAAEAALGLGRIAALHHRPSASHRIHEHIRCLYF
jgi:hypothetical protein